MKIDPKYLPSRKFVTVLSIIVVFVLVVTAFSFRGKSDFSYDTKSNPLIATTASSSLETFKQIDSDHDGLPDWQEALYGTDPKNPDTDGDGTPDGEEIKEGRDPLKANTAPAGQEPNDKADKSQIEADNKAVDEYNNLNASQKFARDLLSEYIASQPADRQMSQSEQDDFVLNMLNRVPVKADASVTKESDLNIVPANDASSKSYSYNYYKITEELRSFIGKDIGYMSTMLSNQTPTTASIEKKKIIDVTNSYKKVITELIKIAVPADFSDSHLKMINDMENMISQDMDMIDFSTDPVKSYSSYTAYVDSYSDLIATLTNTDKTLNILRKQ
jgi:hypothetical protein